MLLFDGPGQHDDLARAERRQRDSGSPGLAMVVVTVLAV